MTRAVVFKLEFDMLKILAYEFACAEIEDIAGTEHRLLVSGTERIEFLPVLRNFITSRLWY